MKCIKIFGAEVSGTKFLIDLLKLNTSGVNILNHEMGYKHGIPLTIEEIQHWFKTEKRPNQELVRMMRDLNKGKLHPYPIIIIKNPYLWYKNLINYRRKKNFDFDREYQIYNSSYNIYKDLIENNLERYGGLYAKGLFVKYEYLLEQPVTEINRISILCGLRMNLNKDFIIPNHINEREKKFYLKGAPWKLNEIQMNNVQTRVDWNLMGYYGYEPIDVVEAFNSQYVRRI
jgi:hypothetical protein